MTIRHITVLTCRNDKTNELLDRRAMFSRVMADKPNSFTMKLTHPSDKPGCVRKSYITTVSCVPTDSDRTAVEYAATVADGFTADEIEFLRKEVSTSSTTAAELETARKLNEAKDAEIADLQRKLSAAAAQHAERAANKK